MPPTENKKLIAWVDEIAALAQPDSVEWCDGSADEYDRLCQLLVDNGTFTKLSEAKRPNSYWPTLTRPTWPGGGPDLHLLDPGVRRRAHQQLARPGRDAGHAH